MTGFPRVAPYLTCGCFVICGVWQVAKRGLCMTQTGTPYYASPEVWRDMPYDAGRSQLPAGASRPPNVHWNDEMDQPFFAFLETPSIIFVRR